ncbi:hypothetical protein [Limnobacter sp.]|uniref:hypothetical protein n=1 Tax=Limnobacter sp. TaxID=2003368 RepID=UPI0035182C38
MPKPLLVYRLLLAICLAWALPMVQGAGHVHALEHREPLKQAELGHHHHHSDTLHLCLLVDGLTGAQSLLSSAPAVQPPMPSPALRLKAALGNPNPHCALLARTRVRDPPRLS